MHSSLPGEDMDGYTCADARAEVEQRKHELDAYNDTKAAAAPKKKNKKNLPVPTENHMKMRFPMRKLAWCMALS